MNPLRMMHSDHATCMLSCSLHCGDAWQIKMLGLKPILASSVRASKRRRSPVEVSEVVNVYMHDNTELFQNLTTKRALLLQALFIIFKFYFCSLFSCSVPLIFVTEAVACQCAFLVSMCWQGIYSLSLWCLLSRNLKAHHRY